MQLSNDKWYDLGYELGQIRSDYRKVARIISSNFALADKISRKFSSLDAKWICILRSTLDREMFYFYPSDTSVLPDYDVKLVKVFYGLGETDTIASDEQRCYKQVSYKRSHSRTLDEKEYHIINDFMEHLKDYITHTNDLIFKGRNKFMERMMAFLDKLQNEIKECLV